MNTTITKLDTASASLIFVVAGKPDTMLIGAGADLLTVQKLAGHRRASTTAGYDRRGERAKRDAVGRLHLAWTG